MQALAILEEDFRSAATGRTSWADPLTALTDMLGARMGQLALVDHDGNLMLNVFTQHALDAADEYMACRGYDPAFNPRSRAIVSGPAMRCLVDEDFIDQQQIARSPIYQGLFKTHDVPHCGLVRLAGPPGGRLGGLTMLWPGSAGPADDHKRKVLEALAPSLSASLSLATHLDDMKTKTLLDTVEMLVGPAILLGASRGIIAISAAAEQLVRSASYLTVRAGRLTAVVGQCETALAAAFRQTTQAGTPAGLPVKLVIASAQQRSPILVEIHRLPDRDHEGPVDARVLLTIRVQRPDLPTSAADALRKAFDMTVAEAAVAELFAMGHDLVTVAARRDVGVETIRSQLKAIFQKTGTRRQAELVLALAPYR
jgi:DNA-binding CsgD family transcriptional regulator